MYKNKYIYIKKREKHIHTHIHTYTQMHTFTYIHTHPTIVYILLINIPFQKCSISILDALEWQLCA